MTIYNVERRISARKRSGPSVRRLVQGHPTRSDGGHATQMDFGTDIGVQPRIAHWPTRQLELRPAAYTMKCPNGGAGRLLELALGRAA